MDEDFRRAVSALQAGDMRDAEARFKKVLSKHPLHPGALNLLAVVLTQLGRFEEAERTVKLALKESAGSDATFYNYGIILKSLRRPEEALDVHSEEMCRSCPVQPQCKYSLVK